MLPSRDALRQLLDGDTAANLQHARDDVDAVLWRRDVRAAAAEVAAASAVRGARDSAAIDGADIAVTDQSPMGRALAAAIRVTEAAPGQADVWSRAPLQVLAHLHSLAAAEVLPASELGRPRSRERVDDPLNIGGAPPHLGASLTDLARWVVRADDLPALLVAAVVHHELMHLRPFTWGSGLVARAAVRCVLVERGVDPSMFTIPELGMLEQGRPAYVEAVRAYAGGTQAGLAGSLRWFATTVGLGAQAVHP